MAASRPLLLPGMSKRISGPPRRPRNPVAKQVRTPRFRLRVEVDRKQRADAPGRRRIETQLDENVDTDAAEEQTGPADEAGV